MQGEIERVKKRRIDREEEKEQMEKDMVWPQPLRKDTLVDFGARLENIHIKSRTALCLI
jgi:hypothetical protein